MAYRSDQTQKLINYFDAKDIRTRYNPCAIDSQLMNTSAVLLDDANIRYVRETNALALSTCPTNLDNGGVYYRVDLDSNYTIDPEAINLNSVVGIVNGVASPLTPYNDLLPIPKGYKADTSRSIVPMASTVLATFVGDLTQQYPGTVQTITVQKNLPITNKISFDLVGLNQRGVFVDVVVSGHKYPQDVWGTSILDTEVVSITSGGYSETINAWTYVESITVRFLPVGSTLTCRFINFDPSACLEPIKKGSLPDFRDIEFDRYWYFETGFNSLIEANQIDDLTGLQPRAYYYLTDSYSGIAPEPNTWGMLVGQDTTIKYLDRRTPIEANLVNSGISVEPLYGLDVCRNVEAPDGFTTVTINLVPYYYASALNQFRILVETPSGNIFVIHLNGTLSNYTGSTGWITGTPIPINYTLEEYGEYVFGLEMIDINSNVSEDVFIYANRKIEDITLASCDISDIVLNIEGLAYDFLNQLWVWDGFYAFPIAPYYNGYILDPIGRKIYFTDKWDSVEYN